MAIDIVSFDTPSGAIAATLQGDSLLAAFACSAVFTNGGNPSCSAGVFRLFVKGIFSANGALVRHQLCGTAELSPQEWKEAGCPPPGCTAFGHRGCPAHPANLYEPDMGTGAKFSMKAEVGMSNLHPGVTYSFELTYSAHLVDVTTGALLSSREWKVLGSAKAVVPAGDPESRVQTHTFRRKAG